MVMLRREGVRDNVTEDRREGGQGGSVNRGGEWKGNSVEGMEEK